MDDFDGDLWGEDDIDEALLIEASQQVEAETVSKVRRSHLQYFAPISNYFRNYLKPPFHIYKPYLLNLFRHGRVFCKMEMTLLKSTKKTWQY